MQYTVLHNHNLEIHGFWPKALKIHGFFEKKIFYYIGVTSRNAVLSCTDFFWNQKPRISRPCCSLKQTKNSIHQTRYFKLENYKNRVQIDKGQGFCSLETHNTTSQVRRYMSYLRKYIQNVYYLISDKIKGQSHKRYIANVIYYKFFGLSLDFFLFVLISFKQD